MSSNRNKYSVYLPALFAFLLVSGIFIGKFLPGNSNENRLMIYPQPSKLSKVLDYIESSYVDTVNRDELAEDVIPGLLEKLDPHSVYIPAKDLQEVNEPLSGNFSGIGIQFNMQDDTVAVIMTIPNGPSDKVGIMPGDRIIKVNDSVVAGVGLSTDYIVNRLKGKKGTKVKVSVKRRGIKDLVDFVITRDNIPLYSIDIGYIVKPGIGYIKINKFSRTTYDEFLDAVHDLKSRGMEKLVLDLRGNGGGYLDAATKIADQFLDEGQLIVYTEGRMHKREDFYATSNGAWINKDIVVLTDEWSASASEILAGAIQDNDRGLVIGRRTFGKGLVQEQNQFSDGSAIRLTVARYYTPTGRCIQKPYNVGTEYYYELQQRFDHGEFLDKDSIHFADSLKYVTPAGKIVYGGGGIMPDIFIPLDTSNITPYFNQVKNKGLIYKFAFEYADNHRKKLNQFNNPDDLSQNVLQQNILDKFTRLANRERVPVNETELKNSEKLIALQLRAYIARNILDNSGFYPILHEMDNTLVKAIEVLEKDENIIGGIK